MRLCELSHGYRDSALLLRQRIVALQEEAKTATEEEARRLILRRIAELRPLLIEMRELQRLTARYYERGYTRNEKYTL